MKAIKRDPEHLLETCKKVFEIAKEVMFEVDGTPLATVKYDASAVQPVFKKKTLMAGWNFLPSYVYLGKTNSVIFGLEPEDAQEYKWIEVKLEDIDPMFPLAVGALFEEMKKDFSDFTNLETSSAAMKKSFEALILHFDDYILGLEKLEAKAAADENVKALNWGMF